MAEKAFLVQVTPHRIACPSASVVVSETAAAIDRAAGHQAGSLTSLVSLALRAAQQPQIPGKLMFQLSHVYLAT